MECRLVGSGDTGAVKNLWTRCFDNDEPWFSWFFTRHYNPEKAMGVYENGRLIAASHLLPHRLYLRDRVMAAAYLVGVGVEPEARGRGVARAMLAASLAEIRRRGENLSVLMPSKASFYYPFGWEFCYHYYRYQLSLDELVGTQSPFAGRIVTVRTGNAAGMSEELLIEKLSGIYDAFTKNCHGHALRDELHWRNILADHLGEGGDIDLFEVDGGQEAYVLSQKREAKVLVREVAYCDPCFQKSLRSFFLRKAEELDTQTLDWNARVGDLMHFELPDPKRDLQLGPSLMGRIVDVAGALGSAGYAPGLQMRMNLKVLDSLAPWNDGVFLFEISRGQGQVEPIDTVPDAICTIGALSQLCFGRLDAASLVARGSLQVPNPAAIEMLDALFPQKNNWVNELF